MSFLSNCVLVQAHTDDSAAGPAPSATSLLSHPRHTWRRYYDARTNIAGPITSGKPFSVSIVVGRIEGRTFAGIRPEVNSLKRSINRTKCDASQYC